MADETLPPEGDAYTRTLKRAAHTVGGVEQIAEMLHVQAADMARWIVGDGRPPQDIFLAALDIVSGGGLEERARHSQEAADRAQSGADRAQGTADRAQARADRLREKADRARDRRRDKQDQASDPPGSKGKSKGSE